MPCELAAILFLLLLLPLEFFSVALSDPLVRWFLLRDTCTEHGFLRWKVSPRSGEHALHAICTLASNLRLLVVCCASCLWTNQMPSKTHKGKSEMSKKKVQKEFFIACAKNALKEVLRLCFLSVSPLATSTGFVVSMKHDGAPFPTLSTRANFFVLEPGPCVDPRFSCFNLHFRVALRR